MGDLFQPTHLLVIAIVLLVLFGGKKLPELGKGLGEGLKGFREGLKGITEPTPPAPTDAAECGSHSAARLHAERAQVKFRRGFRAGFSPRRRFWPVPMN